MNLEMREKIVLAAGALFVLIVAVYLFMIEPQRQRILELSDLIPRKTEQLDELKEIISDYYQQRNLLDQQKQRIGERGSATFLQSFLDTEARRLGITIASMVPKTQDLGTEYQEYQVELRMEQLTLDKLVSFLHRLENSEKLLATRNVRIKRRYDDHNRIDVTMIISTLTKK